MSPFYPPLPQAMPANPMGSALAGYGAVQDIQTGQSRNALMQMQLDKAQRGESALAEFGKSGDLEAVKKIDPATWMALDDRQRKVLGDAAELHTKMKGSAYGNLEFYNKEYRPTMLKLGISPAMMPEYKTVEELNQGLYRNERVAAEIKAMSGRPVTLHPGGAAFDLTGKKLYEQPALPEKPLDAARRANLEADLEDPTRKKGPEKPSFDEKAYLEWIQQPENSGKTRLQFLGEKARAGAEGKQEAKPLTDEEVRRITRYSRKEKAGTINDVERKELKRLKGKQGGGTTEPTGDFYDSFKNTLSGPNKDAAIKRSQELKDGYYERAKGEGLIP